tara:strand:- start:23 stop:349 length:327 start_codon:yes stop_codon:yes gene_type:complete
MRFKSFIVPKRRTAFLIIAFICIVFFLSNDMGVFRWYDLRNQRNQIQAEIDQLISKYGELNGEIDRLKNDKDYIKKIAQEKFHMVKEGEKVFRVIDKSEVKNSKQDSK